MRTLLYLVAAMTVMGLAFWAYRENYRTQSQIDEMQVVQNEIAGLRENLGVLRAEWAYLNRPERLRELVDINFDRLRLAPVQSNQFGGSRNIDYPDPNAIPDPENPDVTLVPPAPSNNKGAPKPRPLRVPSQVAAQDEDAAAEPQAEDQSDAAPDVPQTDMQSDGSEEPADTAITEVQE